MSRQSSATSSTPANVKDKTSAQRIAEFATKLNALEPSKAVSALDQFGQLVDLMKK
jgi:hypothetical protein